MKKIAKSTIRNEVRKPISKRLIRAAFCLFLAMILVACSAFLPSANLQVQAATYTYDPAKAIAYAKNSDNVYNTDGLCATFVSRCLRAGGLSDISFSTPGSMLDYIETQGYGTKYSMNDTNLAKLKAGDVVTWLCSKGHDATKYWGLHTIFITEVNQSAKTLRYSAKNNNHCNEQITFAQLKSMSIVCDACGSSANAYSVIVSMKSSAIHEAKIHLNYSGKNYLYGSDFTSFDPQRWFSRDTSVSTISTDSTNQHNGYNSLKIVNYSAGSSGKDLLIWTLSSLRGPDGYVGDNRPMIMSFWAKATVPGTKIYFRWGYEGSYRSVTLSSDWAFYSVRMDKTTDLNCNIHPYIDTAGTVWIAEMQLEDGTTPTSFVPESQALYDTITTSSTGALSLPTPSTRPSESAGYYTVTLNPNGGSVSTSQVYAYRTKSYSFLNWNDRADGVGNTYYAGNSYTIQKSMYLYAQWQSSTQTAAVTLPTPTRSGYVFKGWATSSSASSGYTGSYTPSASVTLYAIWANETVAVPAIKNIENVSSGVKLTWSSVATATEYAVYRKGPGETSFTRLGFTSSLNYTDQSVVSGTEYRYSVRAVRAAGVISAFSAGKSIKYLKAPVISALENATDGVKITWNAVPGAAKYAIYRKGPGETVFSKLVTTTSLSYTNRSAISGETYRYSIRAVAADGKTMSAYSAGKSVKCIKPPVFTLVNTSTGVKLSWNEVDGANKYYIYRKGPGETSFTKLVQTSAFTYTNRNVVQGNEYRYSIRSVASDGTMSAYSTGIWITYKKS